MLTPLWLPTAVTFYHIHGLVSDGVHVERGAGAPSFLGSWVAEEYDIYAAPIVKLSIISPDCTKTTVRHARAIASVNEVRIRGDLLPALIEYTNLFPNIETLTIIGHQIEDTEMAGIALLQTLRKLEFHDCELNVESLSPLQSLPDLTSMSLANSNFTHSIIQSLSDCENLDTLDLTETTVSDDVISYLALIPSLSTLKISGTGITMRGHVLIADQTKIKNVDGTWPLVLILVFRKDIEIGSRFGIDQELTVKMVSVHQAARLIHQGILFDIREAPQEWIGCRYTRSAHRGEIFTPEMLDLSATTNCR